MLGLLQFPNGEVHGLSHTDDEYQIIWGGPFSDPAGSVDILCFRSEGDQVQSQIKVKGTRRGSP